MAIPVIIDPGEWLEDDGSLPSRQKVQRRRALRVARFIEYGGPLAEGESRQTLIECVRRPRGERCLGLMWVIKTSHDTDAIDAFCPVCLAYEARIVRWQNTLWADGMMEPLRQASIHPDHPRSLSESTEWGRERASGTASSGTVARGDGRNPEKTPTHHDGIYVPKR
jgi:hypothetical protein